MKKHFLFTLCIALLFSFFASAQNDAQTSLRESMREKEKERVFKVYNNPAQDKTEQFEIQGLGGITFTASNTADGTINSYKHSLQVNVTLLAAGKYYNENFQLIFYSESQNIQQAASYNDAVLNIFYPVSLYQSIKEKLDQSFAARKKVYVKVIQKTNGYREGSLIF